MPELKSSSLISLGQLADDGCSILLNKTKLFAIKENEIVLKGERNIHDGLWDIPVYKRLLSESNWITPPLHPALYSPRGNSTSACNIAFSPRQHCKYKGNNVITRGGLCKYKDNIQQQAKQGFKNIDTILQNQIKLD
jgi:hypothetical protein